MSGWADTTVANAETYGGKVSLAEINGKPRLMCMTRLDELPPDAPITVEPMRAFPHVRDLVSDVSWNFRVIRKFAPRPPDAPD